MHKVLVLGAGKIGTLISGLLADSGDYQVDIADISETAVQAVVKLHGLDSITAHAFDAGNQEALSQHVQKHPVDAIISSLPYFCNPGVGEVCRDNEIHYFDLTEDVAVTEQIKSISNDSKAAFVPQCGLAPGFISIAANELMSHFEEIRDVKLRVGALPQNPSNVLKYSLTWSTDGLINEYGNPCNCIMDGKSVDVPPLQHLETIQLDGELYEAFNTSGGLGSLGETYAGKVQNMNYKTMRYPGHCHIVRLLMNDLRLNHDRGTLKRIMENAIPRTVQDVVIVYVSVNGIQNGELREEIYINKVYPQVIANNLWSAIQVTTASGITAVLDLILNNPQDYQGFVTQEQFPLKD
ncbi:MAG: saccharopine dehydrogenase family protein, partial [Gammaproteobacteria bacterium]|nr:saccharopine dehydrogenase family protein [Gammaproteobacteria bacterium]